MKKGWKSFWIISAYVCMMTLFIVKCFYYANEVPGHPDEDAHVAYIMYMKQENAVIPVFEEIPGAATTEVESGESTKYIYTFANDQINYLGHPPLYYWLLSHVGGIEFIDEDSAVVDILYLRYINIMMVSLGLLITFCTAFARLSAVTDKILPHWVFASASISIPMLAYVASGVSNDNLAYLGFVLFFVGALRYYEGHLDYTSYLLVGGGFCIAILTKMTAGLMLAVALLVILAADIIKNHKPQIFFNRYFLSSLVFYAIAIGYYLVIYSRYGKLLPGLRDFGYEYFITTSFYVEESERVSMTLVEYILYYIPKFVETWTVLYGQTVWVVKETIVDSLGCYILAMIPIPAMIVSKRKNDPRFPLLLGLYMGIAVALVLQLRNGWQSFTKNGYLGGYQARYYLITIPFLSYAGGMFFAQLQPRLDCGKGESREKSVRSQRTQRKVMEWLLAAAELAFVVLLIYGDFIYYVFNAPILVG